MPEKASYSTMRFLDQKLSCGDLNDLVVGVEHDGQAARLIQNPLNEKGESIVWIW